MPDYIYLLENRLRAEQQQALRQVRDAARDAQMTVFLTGDAVRNLTQGHHVRDLEVTVQGSAIKLKKTLESHGAILWGEDNFTHTLYLNFPGSVRLDITSARTVQYPRPGKPVIEWAGILDDLRRRDFTANAMAVSLNEGSYGLLMDPLNGAADIEARQLRLVSNYGFLEDPALLIRATRLIARLGWELEERSALRYNNAKEEGVIEYLSPFSRSEELEQIGHEEDALKVLGALEAEGWMNTLFPAWTTAKVDVEKLNSLHDLAVELLIQGVHADTSAAQMQLLTAKLAPKDTASLKQLLLRPGFVAEWDHLDQMAADFSKALLAKENQKPSSAFKLFLSFDAESILWLGFTTRQQSIKDKYNLFLKEWPLVRQQQIPHALMQEMRITQDLPGYAALVDSIFLELIDGKLGTIEEMKAFLEPHSPPPPPAPISIKRSRKKTAARHKAIEVDDEDDEDRAASDDEDDDLDLGSDDSEDEHEEHEEHDEEDDDIPPAPKRGKVKPESKPASKPEPVNVQPVKAEPKKPLEAAKPAAAPVASTKASVAKKPESTTVKTPSKPAAKLPVKTPVAKSVSAKPAAKAVPAAKPAPKPVKKVTAKPTPVKAAAKTSSKPAPKPVAKKAPIKAVPKKPLKPTAKTPAKAPIAKKASKPAKPAPKPAKATGKTPVKPSAKKRR